MKKSRFFVVFFFSFLVAAILPATLQANSIDMTDPRRGVGREGDIRVDAQLLQESVSASCTLTVTWQVQNLGQEHIAVTDVVSDVTFDEESRVIMIGVGSEIPRDGMMPRMTVIAPGEKKTFSRGAQVRLNIPAERSPFVAVPRYVQVKVSVLRKLNPFKTLLEAQERDARARRQPLDDAQFEQWLNGNDTIFLSAIPVYWNPGLTAAEARQRKARKF